MLTFLTSTLVIADELALSLSVTVSVNVKAVSLLTEGAVNVAFDVLAPDSDTVGPAVWFHIYDLIVPSLSVLEEPSSMTPVVFSLTVWFAPAFAIGATLTFLTMTLVVALEEALALSVTVSLNDRAVSFVTDG